MFLNNLNKNLWDSKKGDLVKLIYVPAENSNDQIENLNKIVYVSAIKKNKVAYWLPWRIRCLNKESFIPLKDEELSVSFYGHKPKVCLNGIKFGCQFLSMKFLKDLQKVLYSKDSIKIQLEDKELDRFDIIKLIMLYKRTSLLKKIFYV